MQKTYLFSHTHLNGSCETMQFTNCTYAQAVANAQRWGWVEPKWWQWWQWWRFNDLPRKLVN